MNATERIKALFDDDARGALDRVPTFVQGVNEDFLRQHEEEMFAEETFDFTNDPRADAAIALGFDGIFGDFPDAFTYQSARVVDDTGKIHLVDTEGRENFPGSKYYKGGFFTNPEILNEVWATVKPKDEVTGLKAIIQRNEEIGSQVCVIPKAGGIFSRVILGMGYPAFSKEYRKKTRFYQDVVRFRAEILQMEIEALASLAGSESKPWVVFIADDIAYKGRPMIPPERFVTDYGKYYTGILKTAADAGIVPIIHTDGDITDMVQAFQDVGFRGLQGWEGGCDPSWVAEHFPDFVVMGFGDMNYVLPFGDEAAIEMHVRELMDALKEGRHFAIGPSSVVNATMPIENVRSFVAHAKIMGTY